MKTLLLLAILLLTASCVPNPNGTRVNNPGLFGFRLMNLPNAANATMLDFHEAPPEYQMRYVAEIAEAAQLNGLRCQPGSHVTPKGIYYELHRRTFSGTDSLVRTQYDVMNEMGCN